MTHPQGTPARRALRVDERRQEPGTGKEWRVLSVANIACLLVDDWGGSDTRFISAVETWPVVEAPGGAS
jgi:hypothetical protein